MKVVIVGGGLAGLACAVELVDRDIDVQIVESAERLGGKASSWRDEDGDLIDVGLHVVTPLYEHLLALLAKVGADKNIVWRDGHYHIASRGGVFDSIRVRRLPAPFHFIAGLLGYGGVGLLDRLSAIVAFAEILLSRDRHRRKFDHKSAWEWARSRGVSSEFIDHVLAPMMRGLMFLDTRDCSATNFLFDLHYMLKNNDAARLGFIDRGLGEGLVEPIVNYVCERGGSIMSETEVAGFRMGADSVTGVELRDGGMLEADAYVSAVPTHRLCGLLPQAAWAHAYFANLRRFEPVPVIAVQLFFDRKVTNVDNLILTPRCIFNAYADVSNIYTEYASRAGSVFHLVVAPARDFIAVPDELIVQRVLQDLRDVFPAARGAGLVKSHVVKMPLSFHAQYPGMEQFRPDQSTPLSNLFVAGDFTRSKYPPSMEGAVMSGILARPNWLEVRNTRQLSPHPREPQFIYQGVPEPSGDW